MTAYQLRGFMGKTLDGAHAEAIKPFDVLIDEISSVDNVVFAFPTHNWSEPGVVKTYIDAHSSGGQDDHLRWKRWLLGFAQEPQSLGDFRLGAAFTKRAIPRRTIQHAFTSLAERHWHLRHHFRACRRNPDG